MSYDPFDRMVTASRGATTATYSYWPDGTRRSTTTATTAQPGAVCEQAIAQAGTGQGTYGRYQLVQAPAVGRSGSQVVVGTAGADRLMGGSGNDVLCGLGGNDTLDAGSGNDHLDGGDGDDTLLAGSGNDDLDGAAGFDQLSGNSGNDILRNGEVNDGGSGRNQINPPPAVATTTQTFHYGPDGTLVNDTTADTTTGDTATTASYLLTAGREARTLQPGTTPVSAPSPPGPRHPSPPATGTGYLLRDRHSSVTALIDATAAVTSTYSYGDYGLPALPDGQPQPAPAVAPGGRTNPFQYTGAAPNSSMTDPTTGLLLLPARSYDPTQGRFTSRDTANVFNKYQGFSTNPIINVDPTGHFSLEDLLLDIGMAIVFAVAAVATAGAAVAALPALVAGEAAAVTTTAIVTTVATAVTAVASATGAVASAIKAADDIDDAVTGKHFLTNDQRNALSTVQAVAGAVSAASGLAATGGIRSGHRAPPPMPKTRKNAADFLAETDDETPRSQQAQRRRRGRGERRRQPTSPARRNDRPGPGAQQHGRRPSQRVVQLRRRRVRLRQHRRRRLRPRRRTAAGDTVSKPGDPDPAERPANRARHWRPELDGRGLPQLRPWADRLTQRQRGGRRGRLGLVRRRRRPLDRHLAGPDRDERQLERGGRPVRPSAEHGRRNRENRRRHPHPRHDAIRPVQILVLIGRTARGQEQGSWEASDSGRGTAASLPSGRHGRRTTTSTPTRLATTFRRSKRRITGEVHSETIR